MLEVAKPKPVASDGIEFKTHFLEREVGIYI
jgi:hypothetical protein